MAGFFTRAELASWIQQDVDNSTADLLIEGSAAVIRREVRQTLDLVVGDTVTIKAHDGITLVLPQRPVVAVTSVTLAGVLLPGTDYEFDADTGRLRWIWRKATTVIPAVYRCWPEGADVVVVYTHGYATIPADIKDLALELSQTVYTNPNQVTSETLRDYSVTYAGSGGGGAQLMGRLSLNESQKRRLDDYRGVLI